MKNFLFWTIWFPQILLTALIYRGLKELGYEWPEGRAWVLKKLDRV